MKFTKSERALHQPNYNPPCNVYQPHHILNSNNILTGSLATPAFSSNNTFGYQTRFLKENNDSPGPGAYTPLQMTDRKEQYSNKQNKVIKGKQYPIFGTVPSIPYSYYGQHADEQETNYIQQLLMNQNISKATVQIKKKQPAFSFSKSEKKLSYIPKSQYNSNINNNNSGHQKQQQTELESKKKNVVWQQKIKKANERRMNMIQAIDPEFVPSLELIQMIKKKTDRPLPGPGQYDKPKTLYPDYQIFENMKGFSFTSARRFSIDKEASTGPGKYNPRNIVASQKFSFSKEPRNVFENRDETNFRFYISPENESGKMRTLAQKVSNCPFGSNSSRFPESFNKQTNCNADLEHQNRRKQNEKLDSIIKTKLKIKNRRSLPSQKDEGLLGISTMASTIQ